MLIAEVVEDVAKSDADHAEVPGMKKKSGLYHTLPFATIVMGLAFLREGIAV